MAVNELPLDLTRVPLPANVQDYLTEANRRIDALFETEQNRKTPKFIPSNAELVFSILHSITEQDLPLGRVFCEWGSGMGVATSMAALIGYDAYGLEIEPSLVERAEDLSNATGVSATFIDASYMPEGFEAYEGMGGAELVTPSEEDMAEIRYEGMEHTLDEIDVFFVYPWPGEQEFMQIFFETVAADGAILITYYGAEDIAAYQKVPNEDDVF